MKKLWILALAAAIVCFQPADAQFFKKLGKQVSDAAKQKTEQTIKQQASQTVNKAEDGVVNGVKNGVKSATAPGSANVSSNSGKSGKGGGSSATAVDPTNIKGKVIYVSPSGSNRNDGSKESPVKDIQKGIELAGDGATVCIAEGNYLGKLDQGFIQVDKYVALIGGYSADFKDWNPVKHITSIRTGVAQAGTSGSHGLMDVYVKGNRNGLVMINGIAFDKGQMNEYCAALPENDVTGTPKGCSTGRMVLVGESPICPLLPGAPITQQLLHGDVEGHVVICNCTFVNGYHFGIQMGNIGGNWEVYNNVFVSNRMAGCEIRSMNQTPGQATVDFHHNTVAFSWCRDKKMEDMGYGFRFMTGINADVHDNIFACNNFSALDRTYIDANKDKESVRVTSAWNNLFFANAMDMMLPSGGGKFARVKVANFEDVDQLKKCENNREEAPESLVKAFDTPYLKGFMSIKIMSSSSYNANSGANQVNRWLGMNQQGSEITRVSMYANRYPFEKAFALYGAVSDVGAQLPK